MTRRITITRDVHFRQGRGTRKVLTEGAEPAPSALPGGQVPRLARLMALAIRMDGLVRGGEVADYADIARLGHVTRARVTQIMNLLCLAPDIQESILFLPRTERGRDPVREHHVRPIAAILDWRKQRRLWKQMLWGREREEGNALRDIRPPPRCGAPVVRTVRNAPQARSPRPPL